MVLVFDFDDELLSSKEVMEMLHIGRTKLYALDRAPGYPACRIGPNRGWWVRRSGLGNGLDGDCRQP